MAEKEKGAGMLSPYRALDLTDEQGLLCGKLLGDLGADVIKIERPGGDPARNLGPFYHDEADPEKSLFWWAFNTSKRGITLDIETADGREIFKRLVKSADWVIESFLPGYMGGLGLGYSVLEKINPGIIVVSITPFGQDGPYKDFKAPDIVATAVGGRMYPFGDPDRPPVRVGHHSQSYLHAGAEAAVAAMMALHHRHLTGEGQLVDLSVQEAVAQGADLMVAYWDMMKRHQQRPGTRPERTIRQTRVWPCKDGHVMWVYWFGLSAYWNPPLIEWMESEGMADDFLREFDWDNFDHTTITQETMDHLEELTAKFFLAHTRAELLEGALQRQVMLYPAATTADMLDNAQLVSRGFWVGVEHPELGTSITYPGAFAKSSEVSPRVTRRAPLIGEHNQEIYEGELGISREELLVLKQARVI